MTLPVSPPFAPMEALPVRDIPTGSEWQYEPKWDGFRCLIFKEEKNVELQSKKGESLNRYFPELVVAVQDLSADKFVIDGEIVVPAGAGFSFDDLLQRIHPAQSRVRKLAKERPAKLIVFDLLVSADGKSRVDLPLHERRRLLEEFFCKSIADHVSIQLSPATPRIDHARHWLEMAGGMLDGIIAKRADLATNQASEPACRRLKIYVLPIAWLAVFATRLNSGLWDRFYLGYMMIKVSSIMLDSPLVSRRRNEKIYSRK